MTITILHGPQGTGKTDKAAELAKQLGCSQIINADDLPLRYGQKMLADALVIADDPDSLPPAIRNGARLVHVSEVKA